MVLPDAMKTIERLRRQALFCNLNATDAARLNEILDEAVLIVRRSTLEAEDPSLAGDDKPVPYTRKFRPIS